MKIDTTLFPRKNTIKSITERILVEQVSCNRKVSLFDVQSSIKLSGGPQKLKEHQEQITDTYKMFFMEEPVEKELAAIIGSM